jgi:hypothetical protein
MNPTVDFSQLPLRDIHLPDPVGWWPLAPGWWVLAALLVLAAAVYGLHYYLQRHRRVALAAVERFARMLAEGEDAVAVLQGVSPVIRRFAMTTARFAESRVGVDPVSVPGLVGERWLAYLDSRWDRDDFVRGAGRLLVDAPYAPSGAIDAERAREAIDVCRAWLKRQTRSLRSLLPTRREVLASRNELQRRRAMVAARGE